MRACKKCNIVKFDFQFLPSYRMGWFLGRYWICKKCSKQISEEALYKALEYEEWK